MNLVDEAKRIVIKIGSSFIYDTKSKELKQEWLEKLVEDIVKLVEAGKEVILVSSGSIALGSRVLKVEPNRLKIQEKQNVSVVGQHELIELYKKAFLKYNRNVAQALITIEDIENRKRFLSIKNTINYLLENNIVPIINENDLIANTEIRFGDNDRLSARVAQIANAELLIMLSIVDGLYTDDPKVKPEALFISEIYDISPDVEKMATDSKDKTGGMSAKIVSAKIALNSGCNVIITNGNFNNPIQRIIDGGRCSKFIYNKDAMQKYKIG